MYFSASALDNGGKGMSSPDSVAQHSHSSHRSVYMVRSYRSVHVAVNAICLGHQITDLSLSRCPLHFEVLLKACYKVVGMNLSVLENAAARGHQ
jgi:hypothetical protein